MAKDTVLSIRQVKHPANRKQGRTINLAPADVEIKNPITLPRRQHYVYLITDGPDRATLEAAKVAIQEGVKIYEGDFCFSMMPGVCLPKYSDETHLLVEPSLKDAVSFRAMILECRQDDGGANQAVRSGKLIDLQSYQSKCDADRVILMLRVQRIPDYKADFGKNSGWNTRDSITAGSIIYLSYHLERREGGCAFREEDIIIGSNHHIERKWYTSNSINHYLVSPKPSFEGL